MPLTPDDNGHDTPASRAWLDTRAAMAQLRVSQRTLYRRIAQGQLTKRDRQDGRIEVWVTPLDDTAMADDRQRQRHDDDSPERAIVLVDRFNQALSVEMQPIMAELAETRRQLVDLARENGALQAELDALRHWHVTGTATDIPATTATTGAGGSPDRHETPVAARDGGGTTDQGVEKGWQAARGCPGGDSGSAKRPIVASTVLLRSSSTARTSLRTRVRVVFQRRQRPHVTLGRWLNHG